MNKDKAPSCWRMNRSTKTVRLPCSNGQNYSVSQNQVVHLTPESHKNFLAANSSFSGSSYKSSVPFPDRTERGGVSAVKMIINELESSSSTTSANHCPQSDTFEAVLRECKSNSLGRSQRDKKALSLNFVNLIPLRLLDNEMMPVQIEETVDPTKGSSGSSGEPSGISKLIIKCDSSPSINYPAHGNNASGDGCVQMVQKNDSTVITISHSSPATSSAEPQKVVRSSEDAFSNKLDKVFEREERKQVRSGTNNQALPPHVSSTLIVQSSHAPNQHLQQSASQKDFLISRQSSWSSVDSACVMGGYPSDTNLRDLPSRHSSWGSGDTSRTTPSRNSSWGSYDMRTNPPYLLKGEHQAMPEQQVEKDDIPWHPGTVRRTKQRIEEREKIHQKSPSNGSRKKNFFTSSSRSLNEESRSKISKTSLEQLSVSAPSSTSTSSAASNCSSCSNYTAIHNPQSGGGLSCDLDDDECENLQTNAGGSIVQNLKLNFELKAQEDGEVGGTRLIKQSRSLPSSPVAIHDVKKGMLFQNSGSSKSTSSEEEESSVERGVEKKNVKNLVGKYETSKARPVECRSPVKVNRQRPKSTIIPDRRSSSLIMSHTPATTPSSPASRKHNQFNFTLFPTALAKPLMINHNKILMKSNNYNNYNNIYSDGGESMKKGCTVVPRPPVPPAIGTVTIVSSSKNILSNKLNFGHGTGGGGGLQMSGGGGGGGKGFGNSKKTQQQGKSHPLTKLSNSLSFKQH